MGKFFPEPGPDGPVSGDQENQQDNAGDSGKDEEGSRGCEPRDANRTNYQICYELAGVVGIDPRPFTLRKMVWMSDGRERSEWNRTALLVVKIHNAHISKESDAIEFHDVHPYLTIASKINEQKEPTREQLALLERACNSGCR